MSDFDLREFEDLEPEKMSPDKRSMCYARVKKAYECLDAQPPQEDTEEYVQWLDDLEMLECLMEDLTE